MTVLKLLLFRFGFSVSASLVAILTASVAGARSSALPLDKHVQCDPSEVILVHALHLEAFDLKKTKKKKKTGTKVDEYKGEKKDSSFFKYSAVQLASHSRTNARRCPHPPPCRVKGLAEGHNDRLAGEWDLNRQPFSHWQTRWSY